MLTAPCHYYEECKTYNENGNSVNTNMKGNKSNSVDQSIYELVLDIGNYPNKYYELHSIASWSYWLSNGGVPKGLCRGIMASSSSNNLELDLEQERE